MAACESHTACLSPMGSAAVTPVLPTDVLCILMDFLDIRTLKAASLVNRDFKYGADRLIWQSFYICVSATVYDVVGCNSELRRIEEGCRIACTGIRPQRIRKFTLIFSVYSWDDYYPAGDFEQGILGTVFATLRLLMGLRQLELDLACASGRIDGLMSNIVRVPFPFQLERFALTKDTYHEMEFLTASQPSPSIGRRIPKYAVKEPLRRRPLHVLDSGEWHLLKNRPITHLFAALIHADEVFDLFGSLRQTPARMLPRVFQYAAAHRDYMFPTCGGIFMIYHSSVFGELVMDLRPEWILAQSPGAIESGLLREFQIMPAPSQSQAGAEEDWELMREDVDVRELGSEPLTRRRRRFPAMPRFWLSFIS
ncbi:hypothetical protein BS47DRAFT_1337404 [Hydnum rufescens UP504]|uniref:F-box domain-containing protein n=1 Tax=Hydnum rufescens UP504 TaxID=1448309 RepID=A0A9P6B7H1_9AGAM|nr:hypothetical protein BS47DRAFT_1337404 [Hydnum rufescens UP504]